MAHRDFAASCVYLLFAVINDTAKAVSQGRKYLIV